MARARVTTLEALIHASAAVFGSKGFRNATIDDIAEAANISRPTVYSYAKSKRWLFDQIVYALLDDLAERVEASKRVEPAPRGQLRAVIRTYIDAIVANRTFLAILLSAEAELSPAARTRFRIWAHDITTDFRDLLEGCLDQDAWRGNRLDTTVAANLVVSMLTSLHRWYDPNASVNPEELAEQILVLLGGVLHDRPVP